MRIRVPSRKVREKFFLVYEMKGCQEAVDFLTRYYGVRRMRIVLNGRRVGNGDLACYDPRQYRVGDGPHRGRENKAYFSKRGLTKRTVLHELYHHIAYAKGLDVSETKEDREASSYARDFLNWHSVGR
jgi:hypothetical protein